MITKKIIPFILVILFLGTSCVSKKKFVEAETGRLEALSELSKTRAQLHDSTTVLSDLRLTAKGLRGQIAGLEGRNANLDEAVRKYEQLLSSNMSEKDKLNAVLQQKEDELNKREQTITKLQGMIDEQNQKVKNLLQNVKNALLGFDSDELTVTQKNGKVYVALSDKLLFQSGSATLDKRGEEALGKLASVLNTQTDIDVYIEGHTDTKPIRTAQFKDNWDLSVIRATSVVRILTTKYNVSPLQIQPSGRGEFVPVADNETADGRSKNRRTEIIMAPRLDKILEMLQ